MKQKTHTEINWLSRSRIVSILEDYGFACYDSGATEEFRETLRYNIEDGTIQEMEIK